MIKLPVGSQVKDSNWRMPSQWQILKVGQDHGQDQTLTDYKLITLDYHLILFRYIFEMIKKKIDVVWHDKQHTAHIYQIHVPVQFLRTVTSI